MRHTLFFGLIALLFTIACQTTNNDQAQDRPVLATDANQLGDSIINLAIRAHGGELYDEAKIEFTFREKVYQFTNFAKQFKYSRTEVQNGDTISDVLSNQHFERMINGYSIEMADSMVSKYSESINSVIYFTTLPYKLKDEAVIKKYRGQVTIKEQLYNAVEVTFNAEGGGTDHDDIFYYWFSTETNQIDYLAYQYATNGGGVRFRAGYHKQNIGGIIFQDYINYEVALGTPLDVIPDLYEKGKLKELSRIENFDIKTIQ